MVGLEAGQRIALDAGTQTITQRRLMKGEVFGSSHTVIRFVDVCMT